MADETEERVDGPTPNGGAYSIAYFRDAEGNPCQKAGAAEIVEFDAKGEAVHRSYLRAPEGPTDIFADGE
jgi:hypothetical protein